MSTTSGPRSSGITFQRIYRLDILIVSLTIHFLALALPLVLLQIYDRILSAQSYDTAAALVTGVGLAIVLEALLRFGRSALFTNVGVRLSIDVLNAQAQAFTARRDLTRVVVDTVLAQLSLKAAAGSLGENDVQAVNALLESGN